MKYNKSIIIAQIFIVLLLLFCWEIVGRISSKAFFVIGHPSAIISEFWNLLLNENLHEHFFITGSEAIIGLLIGTTLGSISGLLLWYSDVMSRISRPFILAIGTLPSRP